MKRIFLSLVLVSVFIFNPSVQAAEWSFDKAHTNIGFSITHLVISDVTGRFSEFDGSVTSSNDDFSGAQIDIVIKTASVFTNNEKRDNHLRSADFFDVEKNPEMTFKSSAFEKVGDNKYKISGKLTLNGVTKDVELDATFKGIIKDPWGGTRAGFKATTTLKRYDYNLTYNSALETGGFLIGKTVDIEINIELVKKS